MIIALRQSEALLFFETLSSRVSREYFKKLTKSENVQVQRRPNEIESSNMSAFLISGFDSYTLQIKTFQITKKTNYSKIFLNSQAVGIRFILKIGL